ncbi:hypothetical protein F511_12155 [Dorcoceras hygrometricum]|uniref:Uncharacterized protein n=1 Tax=Dorcoceras hygrometricum TaxID=472368 RepID=A0A2Z7AYE3_9LAMI|nr:hypothetical protein F511_12155 [Dorcoceras hygrometricum]
MGNCQAVDAAALVIQHPHGKLERMYWPVTASEVMKMNPGHYVSVIIPLAVSGGGQETVEDNETIRFTRVKLLRPSDSLVLGRAYRLVTTQEVMKVLRAKKQAKVKKKQAEWKDQLSVNSETSTNCTSDAETVASEKSNDQAIRPDRHQRRSGSTNFTTGRPKTWRPSLQSISEHGS